jgi:hypothetical protein
MVEATEGCIINQGKYANRISPQNSRTNFIDLRDNIEVFKNLTKISPKSVFEQNTRGIVKLVNLP